MNNYNDLPIVYAYAYRCECGSAFGIKFSNKKQKHHCGVKWLQQIEPKMNCIIRCEEGYFIWDNTTKEYLKINNVQVN